MQNIASGVVQCEDLRHRISSTSSAAFPNFLLVVFSTDEGFYNTDAADVSRTESVWRIILKDPLEDRRQKKMLKQRDREDWIKAG